MNNDFEKKTAELIELANETNEEVAVSEKAETEAAPAVEEKKEAISVPDVPAKKKKGKAGKVILAIVLVIAALITALFGAGCGLLSCATADELPEAAPAATKDEMTEFALGAAAEMIKENTISVEANVINSILNSVKEAVNNSASSDMLRVDDLFSEIKDGKGTVYARAYIGTIDINGFKLKLDKTVPVKADFNIGFNKETKDIIIEIGEIKCGKITIPREIILTALAAVELPEELKVDENGNLLYNTSELDTMIDEAVTDAITSSMEGTLGGLLAGFAADVINVDLTDAKIVEDKVVIEGSVF